MPALPFGRVTFATDWTYLIENNQTRNNLAGQPVVTEKLEVDGNTRWRGMGTLGWRKNSWNGSLSAYYIGTYADTGATTTAAVFSQLGEPRYISKQFTDGSMAYRYRVRDVVSYNATLGYRFNRDASRWLRNSWVIVLKVSPSRARSPSDLMTGTCT